MTIKGIHQLLSDENLYQDIKSIKLQDFISSSSNVSPVNPVFVDLLQVFFMKISKAATSGDFTGFSCHIQKVFGSFKDKIFLVVDGDLILQQIQVSCQTWRKSAVKAGGVRNGTW